MLLFVLSYKGIIYVIRIVLHGYFIIYDIIAIYYMFTE